MEELVLMADVFVRQNILEKIVMLGVSMERSIFKQNDANAFKIMEDQLANNVCARMVGDVITMVVVIV
jgi:hypothetical protein